jgi:beta-glucanase (GH16 family)
MKAGIYNLMAIIFFAALLNSCKKDKNTSADMVPENLTVTATPSTDGSGNVTFTAAATKAVSFDYEFGDGTIATAANGAATHKYTLVGTNTFTVTVTAKSSSGATAKKAIQVTVTVQPAVPGLVWAEEFDVDGAPNTARWGYDIGTGSGGWGNNELQYYTSRPENVIVLNGVLKINAIKEAYNGIAYTSARLLTKDKFSFKYGKIEVRAKIPAGAGTWPAIWMLGNNINTAGWPACGEIDIMEHVGNIPNKIHGTLHHPGFSGGNATGGSTIITDATTAFHNYITEWTPTAIKFYVDTQLYYTFANNSSLPFNQNFFVILNMAMGGNFGGAVSPSFTSATFEIDYVRVYQ